MNRKQKCAIWLGLALFIGMGIFPPWIEHFDTTWDSSHQMRIGPRSGGYHWIFSPPTIPTWARDKDMQAIGLGWEMLWTPRLDCERLLVQWAMVLAATAAAVATLGSGLKNSNLRAPELVR